MTLGRHRVTYGVIRSRRARHIGLRMAADGRIEVVVPLHAQLPAVEDILHVKERWILRQLERRQSEAPLHPDRIDYLGTEHAVIITRVAGDTARICRQERAFHLDLPDGMDPAPVLEAFMRRNARAVLHERVGIWADRMQVQFQRITVRDQRTRWGSCSPSGGLNFSWRLVMAPLPVLDYVVIHELMHLREMNHGPQFWAGVADVCPDYQEHRRWLKEHGARLAQPLL